jgi:DNA (cytosine-5)-methyltransferase 1
MQVRWQVENDPYCIRVLEKHWPNVKRYGDVREVKWAEVEPVDLICGGFPCQPVSVAGARKGDKDERWLWPEFLRAIREIRPRYALVENVPGLLSTDNGRLARGVFGDLAEIGYDAEWNIVSATDVGAPHLRKRVFIVAHSSESRTRLEVSGNRGQERTAPRIFKREMVRQEYGEIGSERIVAGRTVENPVGNGRTKGGRRGCQEVVAGDLGEVIGSEDSEDFAQRCFDEDVPDSKSFDDSRPKSEGSQRGQSEMPTRNGSATLGDSEGIRFIGMGKAEDEWQASRGFDSSDDPSQTLRECSQWAVEPNVGRVAYGVPSRVDRLKCLGNAVVPQVAEYIGKLIIEYEGEI